MDSGHAGISDTCDTPWYWAVLLWRPGNGPYSDVRSIPVFVAAIIVVLVIVFQPEIREMLERASPIRYLSGRQTNDTNPTLVDEIVLAVAELARLKIGALIVFSANGQAGQSRAHGKTAGRSGVFRNSRNDFSEEFSSARWGRAHKQEQDKGRKLHPSAFSRRGSQFPIWNPPRAALGLTERSDAICAVVSEERGEVSLVQGKEIATYKKKGDFKEALGSVLVVDEGSSAGPKSNVLNSLKSNWRLKMLSGCDRRLPLVRHRRTSAIGSGMTVPIQYTNLPHPWK